MEQLHPPPQAAGADPPAGRNLGEIGITGRDEGIPAVLPGRHRAQHQALRHFRRHILEAVHRQVNLSGQERRFDLLDEQALAADLGQGDVLNLIPGGLDDDQFHPAGGMASGNLRRHPAGLGQGQGAAPGADFNISGQDHLYHFALKP